jgi:signal transduction histidine kinase/CheY-like chemotaxis protein
VKHRLADGRIRDVEIFSSIVDVFDEEYLYAIIHDITDKKQLVEDLVKAKEKAEESDLLKSAFMANMSHEIRTPLNGILGFTSLLTTEDPEDLPPPDKRKEYAAIIERSADNLMQLINDILDISKLDAGQMNIEKREFNLLMTLNSLELIYQKRLDDIKKDIRLRTKYPLAPMVVKGDETRLTQIFTNLLDNAVKFTDKGEIAFGIRSLSDSEISFFVSDTGKGIPREKQARIFKRFAQEDDTISRRYGGTGLGLAIVKSLLDLMGGSIRLDSTPGEGSCFEFTLPLKVDTNASAAEDRAGGEGAVSSGRLSILLVEDDPVNQLYYKEVLREPDFNLYMAPTGKEALELFKAFSPEVILLDIRLPDINGLEVARQIRATGSKVWIIGQSAYAMAGDEQAAIDAGCNEYLTKPVKASILLKRLHTLAGLH